MLEAVALVQVKRFLQIDDGQFPGEWLHNPSPMPSGRPEL